MMLQLTAMMILYFTKRRNLQGSQNTSKINWKTCLCRGIAILSCSYFLMDLFLSCYHFLLLIL